MASFVRSKSCSFIPQDLPASELFSDIKENRKLIRALNKQIIELARDVAAQIRDFQTETLNHIKRIDALIVGHKRKIQDISVILNGLNHQTLSNSRDIRLLQGQLLELTRRVDALFYSQHVR